MKYTNTTDIPDQLIAFIAGFAKEELGDIQIDELVIKNKRVGKVAGQWGWYMNREKKVVIIVPRDLNFGHGIIHTFKKPYTHKNVRLRSRAEFLVAVISHEFRHAYQYQIKNMAFFDTIFKEIDAESYEVRKLQEWQAKYGEIHQAAASNQK